MMVHHGMLGLGDVLSDAAAKLVAAGYTGAQCFNQHITLPDGSGYDQKTCSVPGFAEGFDANATLNMSTAQLAAERGSQVAYSPGASYLTSTIGGQSPGSVITDLTSPGTQVLSAQPTQQQIQAATNTPPANATATTNQSQQTQQQTQQQVQQPAASSSQIPQWVWIAGIGAVALVAMMGRR